MPLKQAWKALELALPILLPALGHHGAGHLGHDDLRRIISRSAEHPHRVVMGKNQMADRLVGDLADIRDHLARKARGGLGLDHHHALVANDHPGIWVALGGKGIKPVANFGEAGFFLIQISLRGKFLGHFISFIWPNRAYPWRAGWCRCIAQSQYESHPPARGRPR